jgi:hypothetical protein
MFLLARLLFTPLIALAQDTPAPAEIQTRPEMITAAVNGEIIT